MTDPHYVGKELDVFAQAIHWKKYWSSQIRPYLAGDILEAGAGLGANTEFLKSSRVSSWTCLEPDPDLADRMRSRLKAQPLLADCRIETGTTGTLGSSFQFDAILYIDVLEHIENDCEEMARASGLLRSGGKIIVLAPAHQWLYTPFDRAIGHFRRYNKATLSACSPADCKIVRLVYLDSAGMLASAANRLFLRQAAPDLKQILLWDRFLVPSSRFLDRLTLHKIGKSILGVWRKI
jgi:2-polyprenyl-3-methyl-5-hydroxy-6-metoxy-1,4-benzoquinol methylase